MRSMATNKGTWKIHGIGLTPSDSIYQKIQAAIEEGNLSESHLQEITGHRLPIRVNFMERSITFDRF